MADPRPGDAIIALGYPDVDDVQRSPDELLRPTTPFVTNTYDTLGRVMSQANANNAAGGRIEWRQYLMQRQGNIYYASASLVPRGSDADAPVASRMHSACVGNTT